MEPGDLLLFPPAAVHHYGRAPDAREWYHRWVYFRPRAYWTDWLKWPQVTEQVGRLQLADNQLLTEFDALFLDIEETHKQLRPMSEQLAMNLLERLLIRCYEASSQNAYPAIDHRVHEACQILSESLSAEIRWKRWRSRYSCLPRASRTCFASRWGEHSALARGSAHHAGQAAAADHAAVGRHHRPAGGL